ncbi:cytochrome P450 4V2-like [Arctopsyche grandis]|uniref:cytochrome P450 4V2-like n=1 Tax=Arctopsyche grandis TaxID=121162 RepID=UPI00406D9864
MLLLICHCRLYKSISERMYKIWIHPYVAFRFSKHYKIQKEGMENFNKFLNNVIDERTKAIQISKKSNPDEVSLDRLLEIKEENGENIFSREEIKEELITLFTASEDTTMTVTSFVLLMLGMHEDVQRKVWQEQVQVLGSNGSRNVQIETHHLKDMKYLQMVIEETLRLFPVAPLIIRKVIKDVDIGPVTLKKDVNLMINIYSMHRDESIWSEPNKFNPLRFTPEEKSKRNPYSYIPFSAGFRGCIGKPFAFVTFANRLHSSVHLEPHRKTIHHIQ